MDSSHGTPSLTFFDKHKLAILWSAGLLLGIIGLVWLFGGSGSPAAKTEGDLQAQLTKMRQEQAKLALQPPIKVEFQPQPVGSGDPVYRVGENEYKLTRADPTVVFDIGSDWSGWVDASQVVGADLAIQMRDGSDSDLKGKFQVRFRDGYTATIAGRNFPGFNPQVDKEYLERNDCSWIICIRQVGGPQDCYRAVVTARR